MGACRCRKPGRTLLFFSLAGNPAGARTVEFPMHPLVPSAHGGRRARPDIRSCMKSRPKSCSAASALWAWQRIVRFRGVSPPPSACASSWCSSRNRVSRQRVPNSSTNVHCSPSRSRTSCRTAAAPRWRAGADVVYASCSPALQAVPQSVRLLLRALSLPTVRPLGQIRASRALPRASRALPRASRALPRALPSPASGEAHRTCVSRVARPAGAALVDAPLRASGWERRARVGSAPARASPRIPATL